MLHIAPSCGSASSPGAIVESRAKVVIASPYVKDGKVTAVPWFREKMSRWANKLLSMSANGHLSTLTGMVRAYDTVFLHKLNLKAWDFEIDTEIIYKAQILRARIVEVPAHLDWTDRLEVPERGLSIRVLRGILGQGFSSFLFRPFIYFIVPGLTVLVVALFSLAGRPITPSTKCSTCRPALPRTAWPPSSNWCRHG